MPAPAPLARQGTAGRRAALASLLCLALAGPAAAQVTQIATWTGDATDDQFGEAVTRVGDVDGDGVPDLAVGAPETDGLILLPFPLLVPDQGEVRVYSGATLTELWRATGPTTSGSEYGFALCDAGDVNGDGRDDVLVGAPEGDGFAPNAGFVELLSGLDGSSLRVFNGYQAGQRFGAALCAGPLDPSPGWELVVGAPDHDLDDTQGGLLQEGFLYVLRLDDGSVARFLPGTDYQGDNLFVDGTWDRIGWGSQLAYIGDDDGDGYGEIVASAPFSSYTSGSGSTSFNTGFVRGFEPLGDGPVPGEDYSAAGLLAGGFRGRELCSLGASLFGVGGHAVAVSLPGQDKVEVFESALALGGSELFELGLWTTLSGSLVEDVTRLAPAGDADADGTPDLALGAPGFTSGAVGRVSVHSMASLAVVEVLEGPAPGDRFGSGVAATDRDGDGRWELAVGARLDDTAAPDAGAVRVYEDLGCAVPPQALNYGSGLAGLLGVPELTPIGLPFLGGLMDVQVGNSAGVPSQAFLFLGLAPASLPVKGGTLLVQELLTVPLLLPAGGVLLPVSVPDDALLCGVSLYGQCLQVDPAAPKNVAFTPGLELVFGG